VPFVSGAFQQGLRDHGYREGENITVEFRFSEGHDELFVDMARELVGLEVDVMVASNTAGLQAAVLATRTIPIVTVGDQLALGMADNLARPRSNVTGPSNLAPTVARRWPPFPPAWHGRQRPAGAIRQHLSR
jgi:putative ABC transport system substrate-binding protein